MIACADSVVKTEGGRTGHLSWHELCKLKDRSWYAAGCDDESQMAVPANEEGHVPYPITTLSSYELDVLEILQLPESRGKQHRAFVAKSVST